jgi:hypothetical protein
MVSVFLAISKLLSDRPLCRQANFKQSSNCIYVYIYIYIYDTFLNRFVKVVCIEHRKVERLAIYYQHSVINYASFETIPATIYHHEV